MSRIKKVEIQPALNVLVNLHDNEKALKKITELGGLQHENVSLSAIAGIVRYLVKMRDGE